MTDSTSVPPGTLAPATGARTVTAEAYEELLARERVARAEAERSAQVTSRITTHLADGICLMDERGRLTYMNPAAERILGWRQDDLIGDVLHARVHYKRPDGRPFPMHECPLGQVLSEGKPVLELEDQWVRRDGSFVHVVTTCSPILTDGVVTGAVLSLHDDTERRGVAAERQRLLDEVMAANRAKSEFLAVMSHELRTPLNAIGGYVELLTLGIRGALTPQQRDDLERIRRSQEHLLGLINQVLNFTRVEAGAVHYDMADVRVADALAAAEALVAPQVRTRGLALRVSPPDGELALHADADKLQQVLLNLIGNAIKFTEPGGEIHLATEARGADVAIRVTDTGIGIAGDKLATIFEPFVQVDQRLTRPHDGVGLGLAISRELSRGMGGDLAVESAPGRGSTFTLVLPRARAA